MRAARRGENVMGRGTVSATELAELAAVPKALLPLDPWAPAVALC